MSCVMLHGVLNLPPELWSDSAIDTAQRHACYVEASKLITQLQVENAALLGLLREARDELEFWTPDESLATADESEALNNYYALRDRIAAELAAKKE